MVADALSRPVAAPAGTAWVCAAIADKSPLDLKDMAVYQIFCTQVQALRSSPGLRIITQKVSDLDLIGDSSTGILCPLVHCPKTLETKIMLLELMLYRMYTCVLQDIKNLYSLYKNLLCCI